MMSNNSRNIPHYSDQGQYPGSYYAASANAKPERPALKDSVETEMPRAATAVKSLTDSMPVWRKFKKVTVRTRPILSAAWLPEVMVLSAALSPITTLPVI